jgi:hypothetical protein
MSLPAGNGGIRHVRLSRTRIDFLLAARSGNYSSPKTVRPLAGADLPQVHAAPARAQVLLAAEGMRRRSRAARTVAGRCGSLMRHRDFVCASVAEIAIDIWTLRFHAP